MYGYYTPDGECPTCGKKFERSRYVQDYCSNACRQKAYRQRKAAAAKAAAGQDAAK